MYIYIIRIFLTLNYNSFNYIHTSNQPTYRPDLSTAHVKTTPACEKHSNMWKPPQHVGVIM